VTDPSFMRFRAARAAQFRGLNRTASYVLRFEFAGPFSGGARAFEPHRASAARSIQAMAQSASSIAEPVNGGGTCVSGRVTFADGPDSLARSLAEYFGLQAPLHTRLNRHLTGAPGAAAPRCRTFRRGLVSPRPRARRRCRPPRVEPPEERTVACARQLPEPAAVGVHGP
jgi:hypothetical protein